MATTQELLRWLREYALDHEYSNRGWDLICWLDDESLITIIGNATTTSQAWRKARAYITRAAGAYPQLTASAPAPRVAKMTAEEFRSRLAPAAPEPPGSLKCWELVIEAFGVTGKRTGKGEYEDAILSKLTPAYTIERVTELAPAGVTPTLAVFLKAHLKGDWIIMTRSHCLAIRDGVIHDRDRSSSVKKTVISAYRLTSKSFVLTTPPECECSDPVVFSHWHVCRGVAGSPDFSIGRWGAKA